MSTCVLCGGATRDSSSDDPASKHLCSLCEIRWKDSHEFKRHTYFKKLKNEGATRSAFSDFVYERLKIKQAEDAELRAQVTSRKDAEAKAVAESKWEAEKKTLAAAPKTNGFAGTQKPSPQPVEKPVEKPEPTQPTKPVTNGV